MPTESKDPSLSIQIFQFYKIIEYIELLSKHPEGLSRVDLRELLPISAGPEIKCTEYLYKNNLIDNARTLSGKKFKLSKKGNSVWVLFQGIDLFLRKLNSSTIPSEQEFQVFKETIRQFKVLSQQFSKKKQQLDTLSDVIK